MQAALRCRSRRQNAMLPRDRDFFRSAHPLHSSASNTDCTYHMKNTVSDSGVSAGSPLEHDAAARGATAVQHAKLCSTLMCD